jgi:hypothetical protein
MEGGGFMKRTVDMGSGGMIYIPSFIKTGSKIRELIGLNTNTKTPTAL